MESEVRTLGKVSITVGGVHTSTQAYNLLCIVSSPDYSKIYISRQNVPVGIALTSTTYWTKLLDLGNAITQIDTLMNELKQELETIKADNTLELIEKLDSNTLKFKKKYTTYDWGTVENMNNILDDGIYLDGGLGRPNTEYAKSLEAGKENEERFTLMVLKGKESSKTASNNGLITKINNILSNTDQKSYIATDTGNLGNYTVSDKTYKETYSSNNIDTTKPIFTYKTELPNGTYRISYVLTGRSTSKRDSNVSAPSSFQAPTIRIESVSTSNKVTQQTTYVLNDFSNTDDYKATSITSVKNPKTIDVTVKDNELSLAFFTTLNYYNWWIIDISIECIEVVNEYETINQIAYSHITGIPYVRAIYSKDTTNYEFPYTIYNDWIDISPWTPIAEALAPIQASIESITSAIGVQNDIVSVHNTKLSDLERKATTAANNILALQNLIKLNADSDNIVNRLAEVYNLLKNISEDADLQEILTGINTAIDDAATLKLTTTATTNTIQVGTTDRSSSKITLGEPTTTAAGVISKTNYDKLEALPTNDVLNTTINTVDKKVPTDVSRNTENATFVHKNTDNTLINLFYLRGASSLLAGLMTAADKIALDAMYDKYLIEELNPTLTIENAVNSWYRQITPNFVITGTYNFNNDVTPSEIRVINDGQTYRATIDAENKRYEYIFSYTEAITEAISVTVEMDYQYNNKTRTTSKTKQVINAPAYRIYQHWKTKKSIDSILDEGVAVNSFNTLNTDYKKSVIGTYNLVNNTEEPGALVLLVPTAYDTGNLTFRTASGPVAMIKYNNIDTEYTADTFAYVNGKADTYNMYVSGSVINDFPVYNLYDKNDGLTLIIQ